MLGRHVVFAVLLVGCGGSPDAATPPQVDSGTDVTPDAPTGTVLGAPCSAANERACQGVGQKLQLLCDGTQWVNGGVCAGVTVCDHRPGATSGTCVEPCTAAAGTCSGATLIGCEADTLTRKETACASAEHCRQAVAGVCAVCLDEEAKCEGANLMKCSPDRQGFVAAATCATEALCDAAARSCRMPACATGEQRCVGDVLEKCSTGRTAFERVAACGAGLCDATLTACRDACTAGEYRCSGDVLQKCNTTRTAFESERLCAPGMCDAAGKECDACTAGAATCVGSTPRTCDSTGHWTDGAACSGSTPICRDGACTSGCVSGEYRCSGNILETCNITSTAFDPVQVCASGTCNATLKQCDECTAGASRCVGKTPQTCDLTKRWTSLATCSGSTPYCTAGTCTALPVGWVDMASPASLGFAGRRLHTAVWTGTHMIVWGGITSAATQLNDGAAYDPALDVWSPIPSSPLVGRNGHVAVWTGSAMILWGGFSGSIGGRNDGAMYSPSSKTWTSLPITGAPSARTQATAVWSTTTNEMIVWGGAGSGSAANGGRYNIALGAWAPMAPTPSAFPERTGHSAVWTGTKMIVFGGTGCVGPCGDAASYDPVTDTWELLTPPSELDRRQYAAGFAFAGNAAFWGGTGQLVAGSAYRNTGAIFTPSTSMWKTMSVPSDSIFPRSKRAQVSAWTAGGKLYVWGGADTEPLNNGAVYDAATDSWAAMPNANAPSARSGATAVWTGTAAIVWGGSFMQDGKLFYP